MLTRLLLLLLLINLLLLLLANTATAQERGHDDEDYNYGNEYAQDSLYHDYAARQQDKAATVEQGAGGVSWMPVVMGTGVGWFLGGKYHSRKLQKKLNAKFKDEQKELYQQYYNDVYALQQQNSELVNLVEQYAAAVGGGARRA